MKTSEELLTVNGNPILNDFTKQTNLDNGSKVISDLKRALNDLIVGIDEKLSKLNPKKLEDYGYHCYYSGMKNCAKLLLDSANGKEAIDNGKTKQEDIRP